MCSEDRDRENTTGVTLQEYVRDSRHSQPYAGAGDTFYNAKKSYCTSGRTNYSFSQYAVNSRRGIPRDSNVSLKSSTAANYRPHVRSAKCPQPVPSAVRTNAPHTEYADLGPYTKIVHEGLGFAELQDQTRKKLSPYAVPLVRRRRARRKILTAAEPETRPREDTMSAAEAGQATDSNSDTKSEGRRCPLGVNHYHQTVTFAVRNPSADNRRIPTRSTVVFNNGGGDTRPRVSRENFPEGDAEHGPELCELNPAPELEKDVEQKPEHDWANSELFRRVVSGEFDINATISSAETINETEIEALVSNARRARPDPRAYRSLLAQYRTKAEALLGILCDDLNVPESINRHDTSEVCIRPYTW